MEAELNSLTPKTAPARRGRQRARGATNGSAARSAPDYALHPSRDKEGRAIIAALVDEVYGPALRRIDAELAEEPLSQAGQDPTRRRRGSWLVVFRRGAHTEQRRYAGVPLNLRGSTGGSAPAARYEEGR